MFPNSQPVKQYIVLWTEPKVLSDGIHVCQYAVVVDDCITRSGSEQSSEDGHCGGLPRTVVSQQYSDLTLVHVEVQLVHCLLFSTTSLQGLEGWRVK